MRVITFIINNKKFLIGKAPNIKYGWDMVGKGHVEENELPIDASIRETYEESNITISNPVFIKQIKYKCEDTYVYFIKLDELPKNIKCNSYFIWFKRQLPEFKEFKWVTIKESKELLYAGLVDILEKFEIFDILKGEMKK